MEVEFDILLPNKV